jgi:hypothetical protein
MTSTEEACECILENYTSIICGFFSVTFFIENTEEGSLPLLIISSSLPEILEECVHVFIAIRWQCLESFCWDAGFTWRLVVSKFSDMMLDLGCSRGGHTQRVESGALGDVSSKTLESTGASSRLETLWQCARRISRLASGVVAMFPVLGSWK